MRQIFRLTVYHKFHKQVQYIENYVFAYYL